MSGEMPINIGDVALRSMIGKRCGVYRPQSAESTRLDAGGALVGSDDVSFSELPVRHCTDRFGVALSLTME
jgi:hypothetical protein